MQLPDAACVRRWVMYAAVLVIVAGCSRLTFIKTNPTRGHYEQTGHVVEIRPETNARTSVTRLIDVAQSRLSSGDVGAARQAAERALGLDPSSPEAHSLLALSLDALGHRQEAGPHHRRAAELAPSNGGMLNNYGIWLCSNGQAGASLDWFERAVAAPGYSTPDAALANEAACAIEAAQADRAQSAARRAIALSPENPLALQALARVEFEAGHYLQARAFIERRLTAATPDVTSLQLASQIEQKLGDFDAAARYVQRMKAEFPRDSSSASGGGKP